MKVISLNVNGIKQAAERGFFEWMVRQNPDVVCLQDIQADERSLNDSVFFPPEFNAYFFDSLDNPDEAGVAIYSKAMPKAIMTGMGFPECDFEGRFIQADFDKVSIGSFLTPHGSNHDEALQEHKYRFMEGFKNHLIIPIHHNIMWNRKTTKISATSNPLLAITPIIGKIIYNQSTLTLYHFKGSFFLR